MLTGATATLGPDEIDVERRGDDVRWDRDQRGMTTSLFWHLLTNQDQLAALRTDRSLATARSKIIVLEPAAARVDRYATTDVELAGARISAATSWSCR